MVYRKTRGYHRISLSISCYLMEDRHAKPASHSAEMTEINPRGNK